MAIQQYLIFFRTWPVVRALPGLIILLVRLLASDYLNFILFTYGSFFYVSWLVYFAYLSVSKFRIIVFLTPVVFVKLQSLPLLA